MCAYIYIYIYVYVYVYVYVICICICICIFVCIVYEAAEAAASARDVVSSRAFMSGCRSCVSISSWQDSLEISTTLLDEAQEHERCRSLEPTLWAYVVGVAAFQLVGVRSWRSLPDWFTFRTSLHVMGAYKDLVNMLNQRFVLLRRVVSGVSTQPAMHGRRLTPCCCGGAMQLRPATAELFKVYACAGGGKSHTVTCEVVVRIPKCLATSDLMRRGRPGMGAAQAPGAQQPFIGRKLNPAPS